MLQKLLLLREAFVSGIRWSQTLEDLVMVLTLRGQLECLAEHWQVGIGLSAAQLKRVILAKGFNIGHQHGVDGGRVVVFKSMGLNLVYIKIYVGS